MGIEVKLTAFEGPLDLLLHLIEKNKVDIYDIPIAVIAEQYLEYLDDMPKADMDNMSEFLVMAATLLKIKSQMLLPKKADQEGEEEDPRAELVQRLIEYKIYKYASSELKDLEVEANKAIFKSPTLPEGVLDPEEIIHPEEIIAQQGVTLFELKKIFEFVMRRSNDKVDPIRSKFGEIRQDEVRIEDKIIYIQNQILDKRKLYFRELLETQATKVEIIVTFLALLELMKIGNLQVFQEDVGSAIYIVSKEENRENEVNSYDAT